MPTPGTSDPTEPSSPATGRHCPQCGRAMRLTAVVPHTKFTNLDEQHFVCDCGETESYTVARD